MKLRAITLREVRQFTGAVRLSGIGDGLNVLSAPNEAGKSTLFDALHEVLFRKHSSRSIDHLRPAIGGNPEVTLDLDHDGARLTLRKRWGRGALAEVTRNGVLIARADEAEALIAALTTAPEAGGPAGLLWVRQGVTALDGGDKGALKSAFEARRDLMSSVAGEFAALTGGRRMDLLRQRAQAGLETLVTQRGPRAGGPLDAAVRRREGLEAREADLAARAGQLRGALDARRAQRRDLVELTYPEAVQARADALTQAQTRLAEAERHATAQAMAAAAAQSATVARDALRDEAARRRTTAQALDDLGRALAQAEAQRRQAEARHASSSEALTQAEAQGQAARQARLRADTALQAALRHAARAAQADRHQLLGERLAQAEALAATLPALQTAAATGPDAAQIRALDEATRALAIAEGLAEAAAPRVSVLYHAPDAPRLVLEGRALEDTPRAIPEAVVLDLPGIGTLRIDPGIARQDVAPARAALRRALGSASDPAQARAAHQTRTQAQRDLATAQDTLRRLAPEGLDALRAEAVRLPVDDGQDAPDLATAQSAADTAREGETRAEAHLAATRVHAEAAREAVLGARHAQTSLAERRAAAEAALAGLRDEATLTAALAKAETALADALSQRAVLETQAPEIETCRARLARARSVAEQASVDITAARVAIAALDATIDTLAGEGVDEDLADTRQHLEAARADEAALRHEVAVLRALIEALDAARDGARERYFAPLLAELRPLLRLIWPDSALVFDSDDLLPTHLVRDGRAEAIGTLSGGTREQVALLVRLAFARLLARSGRAVPVILDDALVYSDDERIEAMFTALHAQAADLQILVFSCRNRALKALGGQRLVLETLP